MVTPAITFGTDGWRAVIADSFTFDNVRRVSEAVAVAARGLKPPADVDRNTLVVGYDRRFLSRDFALAAAEVLKAAGFRAIVSNGPTPSCLPLADRPLSTPPWTSIATASWRNTRSR